MTTHTTATQVANGSVGYSKDSLLGTLAQAFLAAYDAMAVWNIREAQRRHLLELDDRLLRDIGLSRSDAEREAEKPFWRA